MGQTGNHESDTGYLEPIRYALTGPLSITKGCDQTWIDFDPTSKQRTTLATEPGITFSSSNPGTFTDLLCYLPWLAAQYGMRTADSYLRPAYCDTSSGDRADLEQEVCRGQEAVVGRVVEDQSWDTCDFTFEGIPSMEGVATRLPRMLYDRCIRYSRGTVFLLSRTFQIVPPDLLSTYGYLCANSKGVLLNCAANCRGVDPNAMVAAGIAVLAASSIGAAGLITTGGVGLAMVGVGTATARMTCSFPFCQTRRSRQCCLLRMVGGRVRCPNTC